MLQRHHRPVGLVYAVKCSLHLGIVVVGRHGLGDACQLVGGGDGATHVYGLRDHCRGHEYVARVGVESLYYALSAVVDGIAHGGAHAAQLLADVLRLFGREHSVLREFGEQCGHVLAETRAQVVAESRQGALLLVVEQ